MNISNIKTWTDDHLPCMSFVTDTHNIEVWWSDKNLASRLEMASEGEITIEAALKNHNELRNIITDPVAATLSLPDSVDEVVGDTLSFNIECGWVKVTPKK